MPVVPASRKSGSVTAALGVQPWPVRLGTLPSLRVPLLAPPWEPLVLPHPPSSPPPVNPAPSPCESSTVPPRPRSLSAAAAHTAMPGPSAAGSGARRSSARQRAGKAALSLPTSLSSAAPELISARHLELPRATSTQRPFVLILVLSVTTSFPTAPPSPPPSTLALGTGCWRGHRPPAWPKRRLVPQNRGHPSAAARWGRARGTSWEGTQSGATMPCSADCPRVTSNTQFYTCIGCFQKTDQILRRCFLRSCRSVNNGGTKPQSLMCPHKKNHRV